MERVTYWNEEYGCWSYRCASGDAAKRLAAYEDTRLEPEDIPTGLELANVYAALQLLKQYEECGPIDHLRELVTAEREGRLAVLPCKVGDIVYYTGGGQVTEMKVGDIFPTGFIVKGKLCNAYLVTPYTYACAALSDFGETVFLTREEAAATLEKGATP